MLFKKKETIGVYETAEEFFEFYSGLGYKLLTPGDNDVVKMAHRLADGVVVVKWSKYYKKPEAMAFSDTELSLLLEGGYFE